MAGEGPEINEIDAALGELADALARTAESDPDWPELHAELAELHRIRSDDLDPGPRLADLDAAVAHQRAALGWLLKHQAQDCDVADANALLGFMLFFRFRVARLSLPPDDLALARMLRAQRDEAIERLSFAQAADGDLSDHEVAAAIGQLRYDRYSYRWADDSAADRSAAEPADLDAAIELLTGAALTGEATYDDLMTLIFALYDRVMLTSERADLDAMITWGAQLRDREDADPQDADCLEEILATTRFERGSRADAGPTRDADLTAVIAYGEGRLKGTNPSDEERARLLSLTAQAISSRAAARGVAAAEDLDRLVDYAWRALQALPPDDEDRPHLAVGLATGLDDLSARSGQPVDLAMIDAVVSSLSQAESAFAEDPAFRALVQAELAHFLVMRGEQTGSATDLAAAEPWLSRAIPGLRPADPVHSKFIYSAATDMSTLALHGTGLAELGPAIKLCKAVLRHPEHYDPDSLTAVRSALGVLCISRAGATHSGADISEAIGYLTASFDELMPDTPTRQAVANHLGAALMSRFQQTGDVQDRDAARYYVNAVGEGDVPPAEIAAKAWASGQLSTLEALGGDPAAIEEAVRYLREAVVTLPPDHPEFPRLRSDLGLMLMIRSGISGKIDLADLGEAETELRAALALMPPGRNLWRPLTLLRLALATVGHGLHKHDPRQVQAGIDKLTDAIDQFGPDFGQRPRLLATLGTAWDLHYNLSGDQHSLTNAANWLGQASDQMSAQPGNPMYADCLSALARVQQASGHTAQARRNGLMSLRARGRDVMLQSGSSRGLFIARTAADEAEQRAAWCLEDHLPGAAVEALELGRALTLHAATGVAQVPELLAQAGRADLADEWQAQAAQFKEMPWDSDADGALTTAAMLTGQAPLELPNDLRARVLGALTGPALDGLTAPVPIAAIRSALASTGADALVYLLGAEKAQIGHAIVVLATAQAEDPPQVIELPMVRRDQPALIYDYAAKLALTMNLVPPTETSGTGPTTIEEFGPWRQALGDLCDWAGLAVMRPLLEQARLWAPGRPPRLVLVPVGRLSLVPWHAARQRETGEPDDISYACQHAVISYAASGRQLIEVAVRPARNLSEQPVIIGNPDGDLPFAGYEAQAIRDRCYPHGRYLGRARSQDGRPGDGDGSPQEVLRLLPTAAAAGASMIHLACHAITSNAGPGHSRLVLSGGQTLKVDAVLRQAYGRPATAAGALISLAACGTDLATGGLDEALTLATAFLSAGAATVVGTRWRIPDGPSASMMFMFHHLMTSRGLSPRDALREAQLWMLDPGRKAPAEMPPFLARSAGWAAFAEPIVWAAATHQGQ